MGCLLLYLGYLLAKSFMFPAVAQPVSYSIQVEEN